MIIIVIIIQCHKTIAKFNGLSVRSSRVEVDRWGNEFGSEKRSE